MRRFVVLSAVITLIATLVLPAAAEGSEPVDEITEAAVRAVTATPGIATGPLVVPGRESEPVILTGEDFPTWAAPADVTAKSPDPRGAQCQGNREFFGDNPLTPDETCTHNTYEEPDASTQDVLGAEGVPVDRLVGYRWDGEEFTQIPLQVDEVFTRYLSNNVSGFSFYSLTDPHTTYAFDREGFRWTDSDPENACLAAPASEVATDPVPGLDALDEVVFLARDAGPPAPATASLPEGVEDAYEVIVTDPYRPDSPGFVYVALAAEDGPRPAFDATNGYVRYERDADADVFLFSQSSFSNYGNAPHGAWYDPATDTCVTDSPRQRRPGDQATVTTPRYRFRYDGRWLMTELQVSADVDGDWTYGQDLVDRWKARAFQQRPGGQTPCCGYEEEENNWGGSSMLMGELAGPVRTIRETWGADSGTNLVRRETFYRDEIRQKTYLRVHPIPPLDGIYAQWDHNATAVETYYNPHVPDGVAIDGRNDEVFGNSFVHVGSDGIMYDGDDSVSELVRDVNGGTPLSIGDPKPGSCSNCVSNDVDTADPLFSGVNALLAWEQIAGPHGTLVTRWSSEDVTPGGAAHGVFALPYYRDDSCFDDGTGSDPGPHLNSRRPDTGQFAQWTDADGNVRDRECWDIDQHRSDPEYAEHLRTTNRFFQGSIGTHGLHLLLIADSDNAGTTLPLTEINAEQRIVALPPTLENVGEQYGRGFEKPLVTVAAPAALGAGAVVGALSSDEDPDDPVAGWLAGDLHVHTTYSHDAWGGPGDPDGGVEDAHTLGWSVEDQFRNASLRGLDYLAITDHNDVRSVDDPGFGSHGVLGVPGYEASPSGHAQMLGATELYDHGDQSTAAIQAAADALRADGGVFQVNHPANGSTSWPDDPDWGYGYDIVPDSVEVWNISTVWQPPMPSASSNDDAIRYWEGWLDRGHQVAATGGSDNHWVSTAPVQGVGQPTTWVHAADRSVEAVLEGVRAGRTFISHQPPAHGGPLPFLEADPAGDGSYAAMVGDTVEPGTALRVRAEQAPGAQLRVVTDGGQEAFAPVPVTGASFTHEFTLPDDASWVRAELLGHDGRDAREAACESQFGDETTYCRNRLALLAMTSALYLGDRAAETELTLDAPSEGRYSETVEVAAQLSTADGPVAGAPVTFTLGSATGQGVTGDDGTATAVLALDDEPGPYTLRAAFAGADRLSPSQASQPFSIRRATSTLRYTGETQARGSTVELAAVLTDADGEAIPGKEIEFLLGDDRYTATTEEDGTAEITATVPPGNNHPVTVRFAGDGRYEPAGDSATIRRGGRPESAGASAEGGSMKPAAAGWSLAGLTAGVTAALVLGLLLLAAAQVLSRRLRLTHQS